MSFAEQYNIYIEDLKTKGITLSKVAYFRKNFESITQCIADHKNQGTGSSYDVISNFAFIDGIKTKQGKPLSRAHINEILITVRKEKGIKPKKSSPKKKIVKKVEEIKPQIQPQKQVENQKSYAPFSNSYSQFPEVDIGIDEPKHKTKAEIYAEELQNQLRKK